MGRYCKDGQRYMAINQYGETVHDLVHPRKELAERFRGKVSKMYMDGKDGKAIHIGYIVGPLWFHLYIVTPFREEG